MYSIITAIVMLCRAEVLEQRPEEHKAAAIACIDELKTCTDQQGGDHQAFEKCKAKREDD